MLDYPLNGSLEQPLFCPKCKRRFTDGETRCPVDSVALVHTIAEVEDAPAQGGDEKEDNTNPEYPGQKPSVFSIKQADRADPRGPAENGAEGIQQLISMGGPKLPSLAAEIDDEEELKTALDTPPIMEVATSPADRPGPDSTAAVAPEGVKSAKRDVPEAFAHTMQAVDQSVREVLATGLKGRRPEDLIGHELHGTYRLTRLISEGPMSNVFEAAHIRLPKKRLAIKMLNPSMETRPDAYARFRREAEIATELGHPHIVDVLDFNITEDGHLYLVMEFLVGEDLARRLEHAGPLGFAEVCQILGQVGSGLQAAHDHGIIHRDMKPGNIFLLETPEQTISSKILDFGISKIKHSESVVTHYNMIIGTPFYMSPEQARATDEEVDHTTDIFALGAIAYQMLTGVNPFFASTLPQILDRVSNHHPEPVTRLLPRATEKVHRLISRALQKKKEQRFQRIEEFTKKLVSELHKIDPLSPEIHRALLSDRAAGNHDFYVPLALEKDPSGAGKRRGLVGPTRPLPLFNFEHPRGSASPVSPQGILFPTETEEGTGVAPADPASPPPARTTEEPTASPPAASEEDDAQDTARTAGLVQHDTAPGPSDEKTAEAAESVSPDTRPYPAMPDFLESSPDPQPGFDQLSAPLPDSSQLETPIALAATHNDPLRPLKGNQLELAPTEPQPNPARRPTPFELATTMRDGDKRSAPDAKALAQVAHNHPTGQEPDDPPLDQAVHLAPGGPPLLLESGEYPALEEPIDTSPSKDAFVSQLSAATTIPMKRVEFASEDDVEPELVLPVAVETEADVADDATLSVNWSRVPHLKKRQPVWLYLLIVVLLAGAAALILFASGCELAETCDRDPSAHRSVCGSTAPLRSTPRAVHPRGAREC